MDDWVRGTKARNYKIRRAVHAKNLAEALTIIPFLLVIAGMILFHLWTRMQIIAIGHSRQVLALQEESLLNQQQMLILEEQVLKNPARIEAMAHTELGMIPLGANQVFISSRSNVDPGGSQAWALANLQRSSEIKKTSTPY